jgi:hypothetical protein
MPESQFHHLDLNLSNHKRASSFTSDFTPTRPVSLDHGLERVALQMRRRGVEMKLIIGGNLPTVC